MSLLDTLERKFGRFAVPHVTGGLIACQVVAYIAVMVLTRPDAQEAPDQPLQLIPAKVLEGELWRLATFLALPPFGNIICMLFFWYLFYLMGTALERTWGAFRYNVFLLVGYVATVAVAFIVPDQPASNAFLQGSVFLAFAFLYPDFEIYILFILPVKIKWLALIAWIGYGWVLLFHDWLSRLLVLASVCNFLLFFGKEIVQRIRSGRRRMAMQAAQVTAKPPPYYHRCAVCGITDRSHPQMDFRYCSQCTGAHGYCMDHLRDHQHIKTDESAKQ
jgi:hypothetical protein